MERINGSMKVDVSKVITTIRALDGKTKCVSASFGITKERYEAVTPEHETLQILLGEPDTKTEVVARILEYGIEKAQTDEEFIYLIYMLLATYASHQNDSLIDFLKRGKG